MLISMEKSQQLAYKLLEKYVETGQEARLKTADLAFIAGAKKSRFYQLTRQVNKGEDVKLQAHELLRIKQALHQMQSDFQSGALPLGSGGSRSREAYLRRIVPAEDFDE